MVMVAWGVSWVSVKMEEMERELKLVKGNGRH